jgi:hypothetical protein
MKVGRVIGAAHKRTGGDMREAFGAGDLSVSDPVHQAQNPPWIMDVHNPKKQKGHPLSQNAR